MARRCGRSANDLPFYSESRNCFSIIFSLNESLGYIQSIP